MKFRFLMVEKYVTRVHGGKFWAEGRNEQKEINHWENRETFNHSDFSGTISSWQPFAAKADNSTDETGKIETAGEGEREKEETNLWWKAHRVSI